MPVYFITSVQVKVEHIYEFVDVPKDVMCLKFMGCEKDMCIYI